MQSVCDVPIDILTLVPPRALPHPHVVEALARQGCSELHHHLIEGPCSPGEDRVAAIARARNAARKQVRAHYAMFLDSDVVLPDNVIPRLIDGLVFHPSYAAMAVNYLGEQEVQQRVHVAMGATLFYRSVLDRIVFQSDPTRCECWFCCYDLRRMGFNIGYLSNANAQHLREG